MKKHLLLLIALTTSIIIQAQDFQGVATYQSKTSVDMNLDGRQIPEAQKERIKERMKNAMNRTYVLSFNRTTSTYVQEEKLEIPTTTGGNGGGRGGGFRAAFGGASGDLYKNIQDQSYANQTEFFGKIFLVKDSLINLNWKLGSETKKIGNYTVYKATSVQKEDSTLFDRFRRGRGQRGERGTEDGKEIKKDTVAESTQTNSLISRIEAPKEKIITAWYTPEIPISQGPANYWGLPGLILEVNDGRTAILCTKIVLNPEEKVDIKAPSKGKEVSQEEYDKIVAEKMEEMSERFRGGNRRGGRNGNRPRG